MLKLGCVRKSEVRCRVEGRGVVVIDFPRVRGEMLKAGGGGDGGKSGKKKN